MGWQGEGSTYKCSLTVVGVLFASCFTTHSAPALAERRHQAGAEYSKGDGEEDAACMLVGVICGVYVACIKVEISGYSGTEVKSQSRASLVCLKLKRGFFGIGL
jgi:hypothetical protein